MAEFEQGAVHTYERTFTAADVRQFAEVSGDRQDRHLDPPEDEPPMVHGLLTATLPTKIGGDLEVLASRMDFHFRQPVYAGETVHCEWRHEEVRETESRWDLVVSVTCTVDAEVVLEGTIEGVVWK